MVKPFSVYGHSIFKVNWFSGWHKCPLMSLNWRETAPLCVVMAGKCRPVCVVKNSIAPSLKVTRCIWLKIWNIEQVQVLSLAWHCEAMNGHIWKNNSLQSCEVSYSPACQQIMTFKLFLMKRKRDRVSLFIIVTNDICVRVCVALA